MQPREPKVFAHRGASGVFFENSFEAFDEALRQHTNGLETDAWQTKDGVIVLHHSKFVYSATNSHPINIHKSQYAEIKEIKLPNGEIIPTLRQFFDKYANHPSKTEFSIDLQDHSVGQAIVPLLQEYDLLDRTFLCCDSATKLKRLRKASLEVHILASHFEDFMTPEVLSPSGKLGKWAIDGINIQAEYLTLQMLDTIKRAQLKYAIWDLHTEELLRAYIPLQPFMVYTNYPDMALSIRDELQGS
ncbi:MAG: glycerophosphodiester phosphodiesterase [Promethearchaeota archaeon]